MITAINSFNQQNFKIKSSSKTNVSFGMSRDGKLITGTLGSMGCIIGSALDASARKNHIYHLNIPHEIFNIFNDILFYGGLLGLITIGFIAIFGKKPSIQD